MLNRITNYIDAPARAFLAAIFILSGIGKIGAFEATQGYMEAFGLPGILLTPTIVFEVGAGIAILIGFQTRMVAVLLAGFTLITAVIFHTDFGDQIQQIMFLKNVAIAGGFLLLAKVGATGFSIDQLLAVRHGVKV